MRLELRCSHKFVDSKHCLKCGWKPVLEPGDRAWHFDGQKLEVVVIGEVRTILAGDPAQFTLYCRAGQAWDSHHVVMHRGNLFLDVELNDLEDRVDSHLHQLQEYQSFLFDEPKLADQKVERV